MQQIALGPGWTVAWSRLQMDISVCASKADGGESHQPMRRIGNKFGDVPCSLTLSTSLLASLLIPLPSAFRLPRSLSDVASLCTSEPPGYHHDISFRSHVHKESLRWYVDRNDFTNASESESANSILSSKRHYLSAMFHNARR